MASSANSRNSSQQPSCCRRFGNCYCGVESPLNTAWTKDNPGRRFYGCAKFPTSNCEFFHWHDEEFSARAKEVSWMLYKENKELRKQIKMFQQEVSAENNQIVGLNDSANTIELQNQVIQLQRQLLEVKERVKNDGLKKNMKCSMFMASLLVIVSIVTLALINSR
ncbi:hypothetical protein L1049_021063 [Liquidambar formosana]|uniref:GRF-type domain-containing protein n=1 Tax=Liquidambar formosana TaxID=63359 RepID=A0AAP0X4U3_LIQFO